MGRSEKDSGVDLADRGGSAGGRGGTGAQKKSVIRRFELSAPGVDLAGGGCSAGGGGRGGAWKKSLIRRLELSAPGDWGDATNLGAYVSL